MVTYLLQPELKLVFCGYNPLLASGRSGHHYAHPGNPFWRVLHVSGISTRQYDRKRPSCCSTWVSALPTCAPVFTNSFAPGERFANLGPPITTDLDAQPAHLVDSVVILGREAV
jgi:hypothetical protein